jgi:hypothetical protein
MSNAAAKKNPGGREWTPHMWEGIHFRGWMRLQWRNGFAVEPPYWHVLLIVTLVSLVHSCLKVVQDAWYGRRIRRTAINPPPVFIIGHWRTGTTLLHELFMLDNRHTCPTYYQCFDSNHFLLTEWLLKRLFWFFMPTRRPMDNMKAGWDRPQEDEFALCMLGVPSPYLSIAFPNHPHMDQDYLDLEGVPRKALRIWKSTLYRFLQALTFNRPGRLVLKSPTHTCRIKVLLEMFPEARFVHVVRNPYDVFPSTVHLWRSLAEKHGLQVPTGAGLEEYVFGTFTRLYERLENTRAMVDPRHFCELKYEDLARNPVGEMARIYEHLGLGGFPQLQPRLAQYLADNRDYQTNRYRELTPELEAEITRRWGPVIRRYGYPLRGTPEPSPAGPIRSKGIRAGS